MTTKTIAWTTGTGNITVNYDNSIIEVTSDNNNLSVQRSQVIILTSTTDNIEARLTVTLEANNEVIWTVTYPITYFNTIEDLKASDFLLEGDVVATKGFYLANDGGGSTFIMNTSGTEDGATCVKTANNLYAEMMAPANGILNFRQFGAKNLDNSYKVGATITDYTPQISYIQESNLKYDCKLFIQKYMNYCDKKDTTFTLYIPQGVWAFSPTTLTRTKYPNDGICVIGENNTLGGLMPTVIYPLRSETVDKVRLDYIWKLENSKNNSIKNVSFSSCRGSSDKNIGNIYSYGNNTAMNSAKLGTTHIGLYLNGVSFSNFDNIYSEGPLKSLFINNSNNLYFGYMVFMHCGSTDSGNGIITLDSNIYNVYFEYNNFENECGGSYFYGCSTDSDSKVLFVVNDIQSETNGPTTGTDPGYDDDVTHRWYFFDGKLGSKGYPVVVNTISVSSFKSWTSTDTYKGRMIGIIGHGVNGTTGSSIIVNNLSILNDSGSSVERILLEDKAVGGEFVINVPKNKGRLLLNESSLPVLVSPYRQTSFIYAIDCNPSKISTISGSNSPYTMVGMNETTEPYEFIAIPGKTYSLRFYNESTTSATIPVTIEKLVGSDWVSLTSGNLSNISTASDWAFADLPSMSITCPFKIRIKGLPKKIDYFYGH